jgi:hypothetical protein
MDYNVQDFDSLAEALDTLSTDLETKGVTSLTNALVSQGLGEPHDLTPVHQYQQFIEAWAAELTVVAAEFSEYSGLCKAVASALTGDDNAVAGGLSGQ